MLFWYKHRQITDYIDREVRGISEVRRSFSHFFAIIVVKVMEGAPLGVRTSSGHIADFHFHLDFKMRFGMVHREYRRITFEKQAARYDSGYEFVAPGHPLLEAFNEVIRGLRALCGDQHRH